MSRDGGAVNPSVSLTADSSFYTREPLRNGYILQKPTYGAIIGRFLFCIDHSLPRDS